MKIFFVGICCALTFSAHAQTILNKSYPLQPGQQVKLNFDYPTLKISTWKKNEVSVIAHVKINDDENDNAFTLDGEITNGVMVISDHIKDMDKLPHRYIVVRNGKKTIFKSKEGYLEATKGGGAEKSYEEGSDMEITVEVKIPEHSVTVVKSIYGIVEMTGFNAPVTIDATYGGIDASITERTGKLQATTSYGQILTNLNLRLTDHTDRDFFHSITAESGKGPAYNFTSTYGKIYLRKQ